MNRMSKVKGGCQKMSCPVCMGERTIQGVYEEWSSGLDNRLCNAHKRVLDRMAKEEGKR